MNRLPVFVLSVAAAVAVGAAVLLGEWRPSSPAGFAAESPGPSATPTVTRSALDRLVPEKLLSYWAARPVPGIVESDRYRFELTSDSIGFPDDELANPRFVSEATSVTADTLQLVASDSTSGCSAGDIGRYRWSLSPGGTRLIFSVVGSDPCPARATALSVEFFRVGCKHAANGCLGRLEAGLVASQYFAPHIGSEGWWRPDWGALTYEVPGGWANANDWPNMYVLVPEGEYARQGSDGRPADMQRGAVNDTSAFTGIGLWTLPIALGGAEGCGFGSVEGVDPIDGVTALPSVVASRPQSISIGGVAGRWVDVQADSAWMTRCAAEGNPPLHFVGGGFEGGWNPALYGDARQRIISLDLGDDEILIVLGTRDSATFDAFLAQAMPIVESFRFK